MVRPCEGRHARTSRGRVTCIDEHASSRGKDMSMLPIGVGVAVIGGVIFMLGKRQVDRSGDEDNYLLQYTVGPKAPSAKAQKMFLGSALLVIGGILLLIEGVKWMVHRS